MQLQALLDHNDFMAALDAYVRKAFPIPEGTTPSIDITAGRGDKGYSAVVSYASEGDTQPAASAATSAIAASLREQGNSVARAGQPALPPAAEKALSEPAPAKPETVAAVVAEPAPKAMGGETIADPAPKADAVFNKPEVVQEEAPSKPAVQPLFNFGG